MAALIVEKLTEFKGDVPRRRSPPMNGGSKCLKGGIAMIDAQGNCRPGALLATGVVRTIGVSVVTIDNTNGADGAETAEVEAGIWGPFVNNGNSITNAHLGADCYVVDDQTVDASSDTDARGRAGKVEMVTTRGVYVFFQ